MSDTLIRLAGLYECESKAGNKYFTGLLNSGIKLVMFSNKRREKDTDPHWLLYLTERERPEQKEDKPAEAEQPKPTAAPSSTTAPPITTAAPDDMDDGLDGITALSAG